MGERKKRNLCAYYFSFDATGVDAVDEILEKVAMAGSGYHHTSDWNEEYVRGSGVSVVDEIQNAANDAAEQWNTRASQWVSVVDRLPGNAELVLLPNNDVGYLNHLNGKWNSLVNENWPGRFLEESPKYWMPFSALPPPPTAEAG